jgi:hypothetical protein
MKKEFLIKKMQSCRIASLKHGRLMPDLELGKIGLASDIFLPILVTGEKTGVKS